MFDPGIDFRGQSCKVGCCVLYVFGGFLAGPVQPVLQGLPVMEYPDVERCKSARSDNGPQLKVQYIHVGR